MKILVVEDEPLFVGTLCILIDRLGHDLAGISDNGVDAIRLFKAQLPDLVLMDINIKGKQNGIELAAYFHDIYPVPIVFITSLKDETTFLQAKAVQPYAFILKPFDEIQLNRTIDLAIGQISYNKKTILPEKEISTIQDHFFIQVNGNLEKVIIREILFLQADGRYTIIHLTNNRKFIVRQTLQELQTKLTPGLFFRTHRSYLVYLNNIDRIDMADMIVWTGNRPVPLSKGNKAELVEILDRL